MCSIIFQDPNINACNVIINAVKEWIKTEPVVNHNSNLLSQVRHIFLTTLCSEK